MEQGPWNVPISRKMHSQPCLSVRNSGYATQAWSRVMNMEWMFPSRLMAEHQKDSAFPSVPTPLPPVSVGAPRRRNYNTHTLLFELLVVSGLKTSVAPIERVKLLMQSQNAMIQSGRLSKPYNGIFNCFATTIRNEGFTSLWRGNTARVLGAWSNRVTGFALASYMKNADSQGNHSSKQALGFRVFAILAACLVQYPLTYAGTRLANDIKTTSNVGNYWQFNGILDVYRKTLKSDGISGLYRGFTPLSIMKPIMGNAVSAILKQNLVQLNFPGPDLQIRTNHLSKASVLLKHAFGVLATYPMDTVGRRMMMSSGEAIKYKNTRDAFLQIFKTEGLRSFHKGVSADLLHFAALYGVCVFLFYLLEDKVMVKQVDG